MNSKITRGQFLEELERLNAQATPAPWTGTSNIPFYAFLDKPAPSLSKHDTPTSPHWRIADAELVLFLRNNVDTIVETFRSFGAFRGQLAGTCRCDDGTCSNCQILKQTD